MTRRKIEAQSRGSLANTLPLGQWAGHQTHYVGLYFLVYGKYLLNMKKGLIYLSESDCFFFSFKILYFIF